MGGQGVVYLAEPLVKPKVGLGHNRKEAVIVIKETTNHIVDDKPIWDAVKNENELLRFYNGLPFIVHFLGAKENDVRGHYHAFTTMNRAGRGALKSLITKPDGSYDALNVTDKSSRLVVAEMVVALAVFQSKGYLHRDIKVDNYLVGSDGHLRLTDFGASIKNDVATIWREIVRGVSGIRIDRHWFIDSGETPFAFFNFVVRIASDSLFISLFGLTFRLIDTCRPSCLLVQTQGNVRVKGYRRDATRAHQRNLRGGKGNRDTETTDRQEVPQKLQRPA